MALSSTGGTWIDLPGTILASPAMTLAPVGEPELLKSATTTQGKHISALDGLRGVAILYVMLYHFSGGYKGRQPLLRAWGSVADSGWMGVDLFFVLSGFLITGILFDTAHAQDRVRNFYARRALRIFPLFYGVLCACLLLTPVLHLHWQPGHLLYFFYLGNMTSVLAPHLSPVQPWLNLGHLWSLAVEEQFYLLWPFVVWWIRDRKRLLVMITVVLCAEPMLRIALLRHGMDTFTLGRLLFTRADSLFFGAAVALLVRGPEGADLPVGKVLILSALALVCLLFFDHGPVQESYAMSTLGYTVIACLGSCLVYLTQGESGVAVWLFDRGFLRFFGKYSYGLYIFHGVYFVYLRHLSGALERRLHSGTLAQVVDFFFGFALTIILAMASYHFVEAPILRLKRRFV